MCLLKFLLLITIASKACLAQEDFQDYFNKGKCDAETEGCLALEDWEDYFLKGECDNFNDAVSKLDDWNQKSHKIQTLIETNYKGDMEIAKKIYSCLLNMEAGTIAERYENRVIGYLALYRTLTSHSQAVTNLALKTAISISQIASVLETSFPLPNRNAIKALVKQYKDEVLPSIKAMCFDKWVRIKHPDESMFLAMKEGKIEMRPMHSSWASDKIYKWYVHREYRIDNYGMPVIDVIFRNVGNDYRLASNDKGEVIGTFEINGDYHWWTAELVELKDDEIGRFRFRNKESGKYLKGDKYRNSKDVRVLSMTTDTNWAINLILQNDE